MQNSATFTQNRKILHNKRFWNFPPVNSFPETSLISSNDHGKLSRILSKISEANIYLFHCATEKKSQISIISSEKILHILSIGCGNKSRISTNGPRKKINFVNQTEEKNRDFDQGSITRSYPKLEIVRRLFQVKPQPHPNTAKKFVKPKPDSNWTHFNFNVTRNKRKIIHI